MEKNREDLAQNVQMLLGAFVDSAKKALGSNLVSVVLFGSAAEGKMRASSDVNLMLVLKKFEINEVDQLREPMRMAHAAIQLGVMFILENEIEMAADAFAVKFADIVARHRILFGSDPFTDLKVSREASLRRLKQVIGNLTLRLREKYVLVSLREEQLARVVADMAGPVRSSAASILHLEGYKKTSPKEALKDLTGKFAGRNWDETLNNMSLARENKPLAEGSAVATVAGLLELLQQMQVYVGGMR